LNTFFWDDFFFKIADLAPAELPVISLTMMGKNDLKICFLFPYFRPSRFKQYSVLQQQENDSHETDTNLAFTIPRELITCQDLTTGSLFHG
jgi:hypothetical protein